MSKATCRLLLVGLCCLIQVGSLYAFNPDLDSSLVGCWKLDETSGTIAHDSSGRGNNGTVMGNPTWTPGKMNGALNFDGTGDYVDCGNPAIFNVKDGLTVSVWVNIRTVAVAWQSIVAKGENAWRVSSNNQTQTFHFGIAYWTNANYSSNGAVAVQNNEWHHVTGTFDGKEIKLYVDGVVDTTTPTTTALGTSTTSLLIGENPESTGRFMNGLIDDVRVYSRALSVDEIGVIIRGIWDPIAEAPTPADKATDVQRDVVLTWKPGPYAGSHNVYFGTNMEDVNSASTSSAVCVGKEQDANSYDPPGLLDFGVTYYWRVDEVNATADRGVTRGVVWSFTTEPMAYRLSNITATASASAKGSSPQSTVDESGLVGDLHDTATGTMWSSGKKPTLPVTLTYDFDKAYKLYQMLVWNSNGDYEASLNFGLQDVTIEYSADGTTFTKLGDYVFTQGDAVPDYKYNTVVDFGGVSAKAVKLIANSNYGGGQYGLAEVRFLYIPVWAREPKPDSNTAGIDPTGLTFKWRSGREAVSHNVLIGTDPNALAAAGSSSTNSYTPATLSLGTKYYWRVDEVNPAATPTTWAGDVWFFTTPDFLVVDDFEKYTDLEGGAVFNAWTDGFGTTTNGATVGYNNPLNGTYNDTVTVHNGKQAMPFIYGQNGLNAATSELTLPFGTPQDFTRAGITTLAFWFYGAPDNGAASLYVKLNDGTAIAYKGNAANVQRHRWNLASFDLAGVAAAKSVSKLTIGLTNGGSKGTLLIDDIRLYKVAPAGAAAPVDPGTTGLIAFYAMENNVKDSSGKGNDGVVVGAPTFAAGQTGMALKLNGTTDAVDLGKKDAFNPTGSFSVSLWANIGAWGTAWAHVMVSNRGEDSVGWQIRRGSTTGLCFTTRGVGNDDMTTAKGPLQNEWVNFTCVYDSVANTKTIYINGLQDSSVATTAGKTIAATTHNTYIGTRALAANTGPDTAAGIFFTGMLDEIRIYNRALTGGEAAYLYGDR